MSGYVVEIRGLTYKYPYGMKPVLKNIDLGIREGEFILLAGASGSGKTTLARAIVGLIPQFYGGEYRGEVRVYDMNPAEDPIYKITERVGFLFQNPDNQIFMTTVLRDIVFGMEFRGFDREEMDRRVRWIAEELDIKHLIGKRTEDLSGGERQKVALAGLMVLQPSLLILDEPTAYLSPASTQALMDLLYRLNIDNGLTIIIIDHRLDLLIKYVKRIVVLVDGEKRLDTNIRDALKVDLSKEYGINMPVIARLYHELKRRKIYCGEPPIDIDELLSNFIVAGD